MTHLYPTLTFRREPFSRAVASLPPLDLRVLMHLSIRASPGVARLFATQDRLSELLDLPRSILDPILKRLEDRGFIEVLPTLCGGVVVVEINQLLMRVSEAPPNLPVEPEI